MVGIIKHNWCNVPNTSRPVQTGGSVVKQDENDKKLKLFSKDEPAAQDVEEVSSGDSTPEESNPSTDAGEVSGSLDRNVGRLIAALKARGELENTLILFASDNGASSEVVEIGEGEIGAIDRWSSQKGRWANVSNTPFSKYKNFSHEGGITSPLIAHWPAGIEARALGTREVRGRKQQIEVFAL